MQNLESTRRKFLKQSAVVASTALLPAHQLVSAPSGKIKIGQIGVGHGHAGGKMQSYRKSPDFEVVGIVEKDPARRAKAERSSTYKGVPWMSEEELLNVAGLQAVAVETDVPELLETAEKVLGAGKHMHLDKPAGASLPRFKKLLDEADSKKLAIQMGYMYRYNPAVVLLRDFLRKGWLGEPFEISALMAKLSGAGARAAWARFSGGMMFELGCHVLDLVVGFLGKPDEVTAHLRHSSPIVDTLADNTLAVLSYPKALATVRSNCDETSGGDRRHFVLCGTEGTVQIQPLDRPTVKFAFTAARGGYSKKYQEIVFGKYDRYVQDAIDFAKIIRGEKESDYSSEHDYNVQETVLRASGMPLS